MTQSTDFFDDAASGPSAPSAVLKNVGDVVSGTILSMDKRPELVFGSKEVAKNDDGTDKEQLVIILQTNHRNWENVVKVPRVDPNDANSPEKAPSEDDGKRAIFVSKFKNLFYALARAYQAAGEKPALGGTLAVRVFNLKPTDKGNPLKEHEAHYAPPAAGSEFFGGAQPAQTAPQAQAAPAAAPVAPAPQAQAAPAAQAPFPTQAAPAPAAQNPFPAQAAPQAPAPAAPAATPTDPWSGQPAPAQGAPAPAGDPWATQPAPASPAAPF